MAKFNKKAEKETLINDMGQKAFKLSPKEELISTVLTTFVTNSYYESENEILDRIRKAMAKCDTEFIAKTAIYTRRDANMRSSSHVLAAELAQRASGNEWAKRFYKNVCIRPDDMAEILGYYLNVIREGSEDKKIPNSMKKGFKTKLESLDPYLIDKYKMKKRAIKLIDLVNLFHPKPNEKNAEAFKRLRDGMPLDDLYTSKILEKEMSKAGQSKENKKEAKATAIRETLTANESKSPIFNLIRNLRNILESTPDMIDDVVANITNRNKILKSRMLPFRFATAYEEVEKLNDVDTNAKTKVLDALETAINYSCENIPELFGNTAILIDHSGSMRGGNGSGSSKVSAFSDVTTSVIANLFGVMLMQSQDNVYMGLFGDRLVTVKDIDRSKGVLKTHKEVHKLGSKCGLGSEHGLFEFFADTVRHRVRVDNVIIFSDMVIGSNSWYGRGSIGDIRTGSGSFNSLFKRFKEINPLANVVSVNLHDTKGTTVFNKELGVTQVSGWSEKIFDVLKNMSKGYEDIIAEIEAIKL
jgi:hypothetical protein